MMILQLLASLFVARTLATTTEDPTLRISIPRDFDVEPGHETPGLKIRTDSHFDWATHAPSRIAQKRPREER